MLKYLFILHSLALISCTKNNVCNAPVDYYLRPISRNCVYNPDVETDMPLLVTQHGYEVEEHSVTTTDGYILRLFRLPSNNSNKRVVYLQHSPLASSSSWVDKGNNSLALLLHLDGFDVWLGNFRGSYYSRSHVKLNPKDAQFWDFSFHELGIYDIPEQINYIKKVTGANKVVFVGHSIAATAAVVYSTLLEEHAAENVDVFVLLAPGVFLDHMKSPLRFLFRHQAAFYKSSKIARHYEILPRNRFSKEMRKLCYETLLLKFCTLVQGTVFGKESSTIFYPYIPLLYSQNLAGISLKTLVHFGQSANSAGTFKLFDYGKENTKMYGSHTPPEYPLGNIRSSFSIFYGTNDAIVTKEDTDVLIRKLSANPNVKLHEVIEMKEFNHLNFLYSKNVGNKLYGLILNFLNRYKMF